MIGKTIIDLKKPGSEDGQALALIALALAVLMAFAGLAIEGGRVYSERRRAQNAADAAAYAAASAVVDGRNAVQAALNQAEYNSFIDTDPAVNAGNPVDVIVNHPPQHGQYAGNSEYYEVVIRTDFPATLGRVVGMNEYAIEAFAVSHLSGTAAFSGENAIHALDDQDVGIEFKGNVDVNVFGGNIFSNSGIEKKGSSGDIVVTDGNIYYTQGFACNKCDQGLVSPTPQAAPHPIYVAPIETPSCGSKVGSKSGNVYQPGKYANQIKINGNDNVTFAPGIYCLKNGIHINGNGKVTAVNVLFVVEGGDFFLNGGSNSKFVRDSDITDANGRQYGGLFVYVPPSNASGEVSLLGNNNTVYAGTVLHPAGLCEVGGTADLLGLKANIICWNVLLHGNPTLTIDYKPSQNLQLPPMLELAE